MTTNLLLLAGSTPAAAREWIRQLILEFGPGFHLDTPPHEYVDREGRHSFTPVESAMLTASLDRLFSILGDTEPYEIGAELTREMLIDQLRNDESR